MQVDSSLARSHTGTGLGLSLVRGLAELHGGTVGVASRPDIGSRFCVWLPCREATELSSRTRSGIQSPADTGLRVEPAMTDEVTGLRVKPEMTDEVTGLRVPESSSGQALPAMTDEVTGLRVPESSSGQALPAMTNSVSSRTGDLSSRTGDLSSRTRSGIQSPAEARRAPPLALVIEDDDPVADLISAQLQKEGFQVIRAATAEEGIVRAAKRRPQLITLDIFLPAKDGWEFLRQLKADQRLADTPVVIISAAPDMEHGLALGARRVLQKPFKPEDLMATLAGLLQTPHPAAGALAMPRVLVVDDNVKAVELVATTIERAGYQVLRAYGGAEAINAARAALPDLVILDLMMPDVSGFEVARALRESEATARIPILVLTAKELTPEERAHLDTAVSVILRKSEFSQGDLLAELRRAMAARQLNSKEGNHGQNTGRR